MYFSSCSLLCSTSAGVSVKIFLGGNAGTTLLPYSFFICRGGGQEAEALLPFLQGWRSRYLVMMDLQETTWEIKRLAAVPLMDHQSSAAHPQLSDINPAVLQSFSDIWASRRSTSDLSTHFFPFSIA